MSFKDELLYLIAKASAGQEVCFGTVRVNIPLEKPFEALSEFKKQIAQEIGLALLREGYINFAVDRLPVERQVVITGQFEFLPPQRLTELYNEVEKLFPPPPPEIRLNEGEDLPTSIHHG